MEVSGKRPRETHTKQQKRDNLIYNVTSAGFEPKKGNSPMVIRNHTQQRLEPVPAQVPPQQTKLPSRESKAGPEQPKTNKVALDILN